MKYLLIALIAIAAAYTHASPPQYVCSNGEIQQVFIGNCPNGWWVVRVLAG